MGSSLGTMFEKNYEAMKDTKAGDDEVEEFVWVLEVLKSVLGW